MRGLRFLLGGIVGGTLLVVTFSIVVRDWSYLSRWIFGLLIVGIIIGYSVGKRWLIRQAEEQITYDQPPTRDA
jgi:hypothetical protein